MRRNIRGTEAYEDDRDHDHDHDGGKCHEHDKCWEVKKERDGYKKERDEYKGFLKAALERLGVAVRKLDHLLDDIVDASRKIGKDDHDGDHDKGHD